MYLFGYEKSLHASMSESNFKALLYNKLKKKLISVFMLNSERKMKKISAGFESDFGFKFC